MTRSFQTETKIFAPSTGGAKKMCDELNLTFLGAIPLDPMIARSCDEGKSYIDQCPESMASKAYKEIFESKCCDFCCLLLRFRIFYQLILNRGCRNHRGSQALASNVNKYILFQ